MRWENINKDMMLSPTGMGIIFYSEGVVKDIPSGEDFLNKEYGDAQKVGDHIRKGDIVAICTGCDSEEYELRFRSGYPVLFSTLNDAPFFTLNGAVSA